MFIGKIMRLLVCAMFVVSTMGTTVLAAVPETVQDKLAIIEQDTYGEVQTGAVMDRINKLEKDYDGKHRTDSMMARVNAIYDELYSNSNGPSILAQLNAIEWTVAHEVSLKPVQTRITDIETSLQGKNDTGCFVKRLEALSGLAFGANTLPITQTVVPANTLVKIALVDPVNAKNVKAGDVIQYKIVDDVVVNGMLVMAKGAPGEGVVTKVKQARNFGRDAEVNIDFQKVKSMDGTYVDTYVGEEAKKEIKSMAMAGGASLAGMVVLGPIGIIGGAFVNGKNIDLPAGTELYIQTKADTTLYGVETTMAQ